MKKNSKDIEFFFNVMLINNLVANEENNLTANESGKKD